MADTDHGSLECSRQDPICSAKVKSLSRVQLFETPWSIAHQAPLSMGFSRQEYWSGLPFPSQGIFLTQGLNPGLQQRAAVWPVRLLESLRGSRGGRGSPSRSSQCGPAAHPTAPASSPRAPRPLSLGPLRHQPSPRRAPCSDVLEAGGRQPLARNAGRRGRCPRPCDLHTPPGLCALPGAGLPKSRHGAGLGQSENPDGGACGHKALGLCRRPCHSARRMWVP